jgi:hypothetical protein
MLWDGNVARRPVGWKGRLSVSHRARWGLVSTIMTRQSLKVFFSVLAIGLGMGVGGMSAAAADDLVINPGRTSFDTQASIQILPGGSEWAIWKAYYKSKERVFVRQIVGGTDSGDSRIVELTAAPSIVDQPRLFASPDGKHLWAFWSEREGSRWRIKGRAFAGGEWETIHTPSEATADAIKPSAAVLNDGSVVLGWHQFAPQQTARIELRRFTGAAWVRLASPGNADADGFRVELLAAKGSVWAFWDEYEDLRNVVFARSVYPVRGGLERISPVAPASVRCLKPVPLISTVEGLCVAWLKLTDVIGGAGVIDMVHTSHVSQRRNGKWELVKTADGNADGAVMLNGLLPDLRPKKGYPSGYIGKRRHPMLVDGEGEAWLIWERKSIHGGGGTKTKGQLLGRSFRDGRWGKVVQLYDRLIDYQVARPAKIAGGRFTVSGSQLPRGWMRPYHRAEIALAGGKPFVGDDWRSQFKVVDLPKLSAAPRHSIQVGDNKYHLFWADLHCHSGLTGDAEGEPDEVVLYGRDRAQLDVMVLQDNDDVHGCLLTEGEYYMGSMHSQRFTEPGKFLALPGYEWTQRKARPGAKFDPWKSVYEQSTRGTYPNHRTVIYPSSGGPIVRYTEVGGNYEAMTDTVLKYGGLVNSQHRTFDITDSPVEANMEVTSCWGIYILDVPAKFHGVLDRSRRLGFVGCSDSHRRNPGLCGGLTGIYAEELTDEAVLRALREHRCFASNGSKIVVDSRLNGKLSDIVFTADTGSLALDLHVIGTKDVTSAILVTNGGEKIKTFKGNGSRELKVRHELTGLKPGDHWFYWEIRQEGSSRQYSGNISVGQGHMAWSSPHFITIP